MHGLLLEAFGLCVWQFCGGFFAVVIGGGVVGEQSKIVVQRVGQCLLRWRWVVLFWWKHFLLVVNSALLGGTVEGSGRKSFGDGDVSVGASVRASIVIQRK